MKIPHYQQVGRNPDGTRRVWRAGEPAIYPKGHPLNPRREVKVWLHKGKPPVRMTIAECREFLGWSNEQLKQLKGWGA